MSALEHAWKCFEAIERLTEDPAIVEQTLATPGVMSSAVLDRAFARPRTRAAEVVATLRNRYERDPRSYPIGDGPIEQLAARVARGELTLATARDLAATEDICSQVSFPYVNALAGACTGQAQRGDPTMPLIVGALLVSATAALAAAAPGEDEAAVGLWIAWLSRIEVVKIQVLAAADGGLLAETTDAAESVLGGNAPSDELRADLLFRLGTLWLDPWVANRDRTNYAMEMREWRNLGANRTLGKDAAYVPTPEEALARSESFLRRALPVAAGGARGKVLKALVQLLNAREVLLDQPIDSAELVALAREALPLVEGSPDPEPREFLRIVLARHGGAAEARSTAWEDAALTAIRRAELAVFEISGALSADPLHALDVAIRSRPVFDASGDERLRTERLRLCLAALAASEASTLPEAHRIPAGLAARAAAALRDNGELAVLQELEDHARTTDFAQLDDVMAYAGLMLHIGAASNAAANEAWAEVIPHYDVALRVAVGLALAQQSAALVQRIRQAASEADAVVGLRAILAIEPVVPDLERLLGEQAQVATWELARATMMKLASGPVPPDAFLMAHQLIKGARFGSASVAGARFDPREDQRAQALFARITATHATDVPAGETALSDEWLMAAFAHADQRVAGDQQAAVATNLRLAFDTAVRARWAAASPIPVGDTLEAFQARLPADTAVVSLYIGTAPDRTVALHALGITRSSVVPSVFVTGFPGTLVEITSKPEGRVAKLSPLALTIAEAREAIRSSPRQVPLDSDGQAALAQVAGLMKGVQAFLADCERAGMTRLVIAPHGALHFFPFALLGGVDAPLGARWTISLVPSLLGFARPAHAPRETSLCALGLDYIDPTLNPHRLDMLPAGRAETVECAEAFGVAPYLDAEATPERFLAGLRGARYVHFSGHGKLDVVAPAFQALFLAPQPSSDGRVFAHELLAESFAGCELVSLSACESGLGRFDLGDNLMGIPGALLAGGVKCVVATLWSVRADAARLFFRTLYQCLHANAACVDAFADAQRATRKSFPAFSDWGAFVITGG